MRNSSLSYQLKGRLIAVTMTLLCHLVFASSIAAERLPVATFAFPPYNYMDNGKVVGSEIDIVLTVFERMGYEVDAQLISIKRALRDTANGKFVALVALSETPERFSTFYPSNRIAVTRPEITKRRDYEFSLQTIEDYYPHLVGITDGFHYTDGFEQAVEDFVTEW